MRRTEVMTPRQRWLAAVHMEPVDRLPFWPKLSPSYLRPRTGEFAGLDIPALHRWIGSDPHVFTPPALREARSRTNVDVVSGDGGRTTVFSTPHGRMRAVERFDEASAGWHPVEFPIRTRDDLLLMTEMFEDASAEIDRAELDRATAICRDQGENTVTATSMGESPLMHFVEHLAGVEMAHYLLEDCPGEVDALLAAMHRLLLRRVELATAHHPADLLYLTENTSTTLISPHQYARYCAGHVTAYGTIVAQAGRDLVLHMCGHLKGLLPMLARLPARAFEAFTSPTVGNTTLRDGRTRCPDKCLIGGTNAALWTQPAERIIAQIGADLGALPHRRGIVLTSAGVMPPVAEPRTIRQVCDFVKSCAA